MKYVIVPATSDVIQFDGTNVQECLDFASQWFAGFPGEAATYDEQNQVITTARGYAVNVTDWMVAPPIWGNLQTGGSAEIVSDALFQLKYAQQA